MAFDALKKINETETRADEIIKQSKQEAEKIILYTKEKCKALIENKKELALKETKEIFHEEKASTEKALKLLQDDFLSSAETLQLIIKRNTPKAINAVIDYLKKGDVS